MVGSRFIARLAKWFRHDARQARCSRRESAASRDIVIRRDYDPRFARDGKTRLSGIPIRVTIASRLSAIEPSSDRHPAPVLLSLTIGRGKFDHFSIGRFIAWNSFDVNISRFVIISPSATK